MKNKTLKNLKGGFAPFLIVAIVAVLAVGGGVYVSKKNADKKADLVDNADTQANANADVNANANANLGVGSEGKAKGSIRSLLALGKNTMCTFTSTHAGVESKGTVYISSAGNMRGDFESMTTGGTVASHIIWKDGYSYVWSGNQGMKMEVSTVNANANANAQAQQSFDLDQQVDYECGAWNIDESKFSLPAGVEFIDVATMMKGSLQGDIKLPPGVNLPKTY